MVSEERVSELTQATITPNTDRFVEGQAHIQQMCEVVAVVVVDAQKQSGQQEHRIRELINSFNSRTGPRGARQGFP